MNRIFKRMLYLTTCIKFHAIIIVLILVLFEL